MTTPPFRLIEILRLARELDASDVHVSAGQPLVLRVDGSLEKRERCSLSLAEIDEIVSFCFEEKRRRVLNERGDATLTYAHDEFGTARIHAYVTQGSVALAVRLLALEVPELGALRLPPGAMRLGFLQHGLVVVTGPTGSGKSTVLAAIVGEINRTSSKHIVTIEDPIEYRHRPQRSLVSQREVESDVVTFEAAVVGALRSDPDVIVLGEMRGRPTMQAAINAAETGHLILATMHTASASDCIERIVGAFDGEAQAEVRMQLAETLAGVVALRLLKRAGGRGRVAVAEVLLASDAVRSTIREAKTHQMRNIISTGRHLGMQTFESSLSELVSRGEITVEAAVEVSRYPEELHVPVTRS